MSNGNLRSTKVTVQVGYATAHFRSSGDSAIQGAEGAVRPQEFVHTHQRHAVIDSRVSRVHWTRFGAMRQGSSVEFRLRLLARSRTALC